MKRAVIWSRDALDDLGKSAAHVPKDNPFAARRLATKIRKMGGKLGEMATGRRGRVSGTYEKPVPKLSYILVYALITSDGHEVVSVLRVIHAARDWPDEQWPE